MVQSSRSHEPAELQNERFCSWKVWGGGVSYFLWGLAPLQGAFFFPEIPQRAPIGALGVHWVTTHGKPRDCTGSYIVQSPLTGIGSVSNDTKYWTLQAGMTGKEKENAHIIKTRLTHQGEQQPLEHLRWQAVVVGEEQHGMQQKQVQALSRKACPVQCFARNNPEKGSQQKE